MKSGNIINSNMSKKRAALLPDVKRLYEEGESLTGISKALSIDWQTAKLYVSILGLPPITKAKCQAIKSRKLRQKAREERGYISKEVARMYKNGLSCPEISKKLGIGRGTVTKCLDDAGVNIRTASEATKIRLSKMTADERKELTKAPNKKRRMTRPPESWKINQALGKQKTRSKAGMFEGDLIKALKSRGFECVHQMAWRKYNFDIFIGDDFAVEVHSSMSRPVHAAGDFKKSIEALGSGIHVCYFWVRPDRKVTEIAVNQLISFYNITRRNPTPLGQYRVIRSNGEIDTVCNDYLNEIAAIASSYHRLNSSIED